MITLRKNEKIYLIQRRHRIVLTRDLFPELLILAILIFGIFILSLTPPISWPKWLSGFIPTLLRINIRYLLAFITSILFLFFWTIIFLTITYYYLDSWIITNERTIHTELRGLFSRVISYVPHDKIQDITIDIHGFLPTFFNFGNLHIQTAGGFRKFVFRDVPNPDKTKRIIFEAQKEYYKKMKKNGIL